MNSFLLVLQKLDFAWKEGKSGVELFLNKLFQSFAVWSHKETCVEADVEHFLVVATGIADEVASGCIFEGVVADYFGSD